LNDVSVIDHFLDVFSLYIDSGFGLLGGEVAFLTLSLVVIDMTLAGLFWAMGGEDVTSKLIKKTLYVGAFAFIIGNFNTLAEIIFRSFAGLGLLASGSVLTQAEFLQPGRLASIGIEAGRPILEQISNLSDFPKVFGNLDSIVVLLLAWTVVVVVSFFILAIQLFVTLIEFKLTTLAGFVLVPFALWNKTAFLAEKVLGNVVSSGIKVLVLAVIVGIGSGLFAEFQTLPDKPSIDHALVVMLAALALLGLGIFGPGIATGLVSGAPQLGAGAAAGTALGAAGIAAGAAALATGVGGAVMAGARMAPGAARLAMGGAQTASAALPQGNQPAGATADNASAASPSPGAPAKQPDWAKRLQRKQQLSHAATTVAHTLRGGDGGGSAPGPQVRDPSNS
jgi:type IV secretion system protein TrbL